MRWQYQPGLWSVRTKTRFLWLPKDMGGEVRWLERATWEEIYMHGRWWPERWIQGIQQGKET